MLDGNTDKDKDVLGHAMPKASRVIQVIFQVPGITCGHIFPPLKNGFLEPKKRIKVLSFVVGYQYH